MKTPIPLSEQLKQFGAMAISAQRAAETLTAFIETVSEAVLTRKHIKGADMFRHLSPIMSARTRIVIVEDGNWSYILSNCKEDPLSEAVYAVSRETGCKAMSAMALERDRRVYFYNKGKSLRRIESADDGTWQYLEMGTPLKFEDPDQQLIRRKRDRLQVIAVQEYFRRFTGRPYPNWGQLAGSRSFVFDIVYPLYEVPIVEFPTVVDI